MSGFYDPSFSWEGLTSSNPVPDTNLFNFGTGVNQQPGYDYFSGDYNPFGSLEYGTYSAPEIPWYEKAYDELGGLRGVASLGLGGLSLLGNYLAKRDAEKMARDQFDRTLGFKEKELERTSATDLAKVDAMMNLLSQRGRVELDPRRYAEIVASGKVPPDMLASRETVDVGQQNYAHGGAHRGALGLLRGPSPGQMDDVTVPLSNGGQAGLSHGEYVMDADVVAALGDGNTEAGAQRLDEMREAIRRHKRSAPPDSIPPPARHPLAYMKKGAK